MNALIHQFDGSTNDADGDVLLGFYYEITIDELMGPYPTGADAEAACQLAYENEDF